MNDIADDPSIVEPIYKEMRQNMRSKQTHATSYRKNALSKLLQGYEKLTKQFDQALKQDLGINSFMANFYAHALTKSEITDLKDHLEQWAQQKPVQTPILVGVAHSSVQSQPLGIVLVLSAWNYPIYTALPQVAAAISAGNSVILKPSEIAPYTSHVLARLFRQYLDPKYYRCLEGKIEVAKAASKLPFDAICFTGSTMTGRSIAIQAAKNLTPCLLQLGGKCPVIVDETADIENAVLRILFGKFINCGQTCVGVDHVYVHQKIADKFKKRLLQKLDEGYNLKEIKETGDYSKIINQSHVQRLSEYLNQNHGGKVLCEGVIDKKNRFISPFVIQNPRNQSLLMTQEIFGPILPLKIYSKLENVINEIWSRPKPLVVYMFSSDQKNIENVKQNTVSGSFVVNDVVVQLLNPHLPFGGVGASGYGRYHGKAGFQNFSNLRSICNTKAINIYPLSNRFAPYTESKKKMMNFLLKTSGITHESLKRKLRYSVYVAAVIGLYFVNKNMKPTL